MKYKILLLTGGMGTRLGELTKNTNKALVPINGRPTVDYIIEQYPKDVPVVVHLGYLGQSVKDYLEKNHQDRNFEFVWLDKYQGPGSSIGYAVLQSKKNLQCPFIFQTCDTLVMSGIPTPEANWIGGYVEDWVKSNLSLTQYRTHSMKEGKIAQLLDKGVPGFDSIHIGLDGIKDYKVWWETLESLYNSNPNDADLGDVPVLDAMIKKGVDFKWIPYKVWLDTGNIPALKTTEEFLKNLKK
jgi:choline kinase